MLIQPSRSSCCSSDWGPLGVASHWTAIREFRRFGCCPSATWPTPYWCRYFLTPWSRVLLEKLSVWQLVKKFPAFYGTRRFITAFTSARHLSLSWARSIQSIPSHPTSWRSILILSSHLRLGLPNGFFPSRFPTKTLYTPLFAHTRALVPLSSLRLYQMISPGPKQVFMFRNEASFLRRGVVSTSPNPEAGGSPLVGCPRLLIQYIPNSLPYWRPFLHPQPEDAPCRGDRDPLITVTDTHNFH